MFKRKETKQMHSTASDVKISAYNVRLFTPRAIYTVDIKN